MLESDVNSAALAGLTGIWLDRGVEAAYRAASPNVLHEQNRTSERSLTAHTLGRTRRSPGSGSGAGCVPDPGWL
jgi:hypothetical protein